MEKKKELTVSAIENGTVIDHIPADKVFQVVKILGLEKVNTPVYFGTNVESKKYGTKGFIKAANKYFEPEDVNKIALVAPTASIIEIKDFEVINKQLVPTKFTVIKDAEGNIKLHCHYCEKNTTQDKLEFI